MATCASQRARGNVRIGGAAFCAALRGEVGVRIAGGERPRRVRHHFGCGFRLPTEPVVVRRVMRRERFIIVLEGSMLAL